NFSSTFFCRPKSAPRKALSGARAEEDTEAEPGAVVVKRGTEAQPRKPRCAKTAAHRRDEASTRRDEAQPRIRGRLAAHGCTADTRHRVRAQVPAEDADARGRPLPRRHGRRL
ncbi:hypothetical protein M885DRAFT_622766, partial [Pelagophyceae sp. CCMP2097]